jgi:DNA replication protein DnaC
MWLMRAARLSVSDASLENVWCDPARGIDKAMIRDLATGKWIQNKQNVIVVGKTGVGIVGASLAQAACRNGMRALCARVPRLLHELGIARADGSYTAALARLAKLDVRIPAIVIAEIVPS